MENIENKQTKIDKDGQYELSFDSNKDKENIEVKKTWREKVGENVFGNKMRNFKIGPALWDKVVIDDDGNILKVNGKTYEDWNEMEELIEDRPGDMYNYK